MKSLSLKLTLAIATFFIGASVVGVWYCLLNKSVGKRSLSEAIPLVTPVAPTYANPCNYPQPIDRKLSGEEAVYRAECFIIQNGYTDLPPMADKSQLTPENVFPGTDEEGLKRRHDSLERKAYSYYRSEIYGGSWVVMFRYKQHPDVVKFYGDKLNYIGRAVVMDFYGKDLRVQHSDYPLKMPEAKIINP